MSDQLTASTVALKLQERFGEKILSVDTEAHDPGCQVAPAALAEVALYCRDELDFNYLRCLSGVDYLDKKKTTDELGVVYHLGNIPNASQEFTLSVRLERENPTVPTVEQIWRTADWHEREVYDMMGIRFAGHPDLRRILLYAEFEGHPLRKDYETEHRQPRIPARPGRTHL